MTTTGLAFAKLLQNLESLDSTTKCAFLTTLGVSHVNPRSSVYNYVNSYSLGFKVTEPMSEVRIKMVAQILPACTIQLIRDHSAACGRPFSPDLEGYLTRLDLGQVEQCSGKEDAIQVLTDRMESARATYEQPLRHEIENLTTKLQESNEKYTDLTRHRDALLNTVATSNSVITELESKISQYEYKIKTLEKEKDELRSTVDELRQVIRTAAPKQEQTQQAVYVPPPAAPVTTAQFISTNTCNKFGIVQQNINRFSNSDKSLIQLCTQCGWSPNTGDDLWTCLQSTICTATGRPWVKLGEPMAPLRKAIESLFPSHIIRVYIEEYDATL